MSIDGPSGASSTSPSSGSAAEEPSPPEMTDADLEKEVARLMDEMILEDAMKESDAAKRLKETLEDM